MRARASELRLEPAVGGAEPAATAEPAGELAGAVSVRIDPAPDAEGWLGRVTIDGPRALEREVRGQRCEDVVAALALITVLRLEGSDGSEPFVADVAGAVSANGASTSPEADAPPDTEAGADTAPGSPAEAEVSGLTSPAEPADPGSAPAEPEASAAPASPADSQGSAATEQTGDTEASQPSEESEASAEPTPPPDAPASAEAIPPPAVDERTASVPRAAETESVEARGRDAGDVDAAATPAASDTEREAEEARPWRWPAMRAGFAALAGYATVPSHAFRAALDAELRIGEGRSSWLSSLSFAYARGDDSVAPGELGLTLLTAELSLCPPSVIAASSLWISACAGVRGGLVRLAFTSTLPEVEARDTGRPWLAAGPSVRLGVPLSEHWALRGVAELAVQLVRDTFAVRLGAADDPTAPSLPLYRPEAFSIELGAGIGYTF